MTDQLTVEQTAHLRQAIDRAEGPGVCQYVKRNHKASGGSVPICVIGQLASLEGIPNQVISGWMGSIGQILCEPTRYAAQNLIPYPYDLLVELQHCWDSVLLASGHASPVHAASKGRSDMHAILDRWISDHPHDESL